MPCPQDIAPTYDQVIEKILREVSAPMSVLELAQKISAERPSSSKDPVKAAEKKIKETVGRQLVYLDSNTIVPL
jgi:BMFP domain-containing protein YqiC